jgi:hypothetical protein
MTRVETVRNRLRRAAEASWVLRVSGRIETTLTRWFVGSRIVQWFFADPDPDVIVIDLRETYTVGPLLRVGGRMVASAQRFGDSTGLTSTLEAVFHDFRAAPIRFLGTILLVVTLLGAGYTVASDAPRRALGWWLVLAGIALLATRERRSVDELEGTWVGRAFLPPDPPERRDE